MSEVLTCFHYCTFIVFILINESINQQSYQYKILIYVKQYKRKTAGLEGKELSSNFSYDLDQFTSSVFYFLK